jgi:hypothetical protein
MTLQSHLVPQSSFYFVFFQVKFPFPKNLYPTSFYFSFLIPFQIHHQAEIEQLVNA